MRNEGRPPSIRAIGLLALCGAGTVVAFVVAPPALVSDRYHAYNEEPVLRSALARGFVAFWQGGDPEPPGGLRGLVDYWFQWHAIKVVVCALMVVSFGLLAAALWRRFLDAGRRGPAWFAGSVIATVATGLAVGLLVLNIQATAEPLIALMPLLPAGATDADLSRTLAAVQDSVAASSADPPVLTVLLGDVATYHRVLAATAAATVVAAGGASLSSWRRRSRATAARVRSLWATLGVLTAVTAALFLLVGAVSVAAATDPSAALLDVLGVGRPEVG